MSLVYSAVSQAKKMLTNLDAWLDKATAHAKAKSFDPVVLLGARLAPDQYPLVRQVQSACDNAKFFAARLSDKEAPKNPDTEQTMEEVKARIRSTVGFLDTLAPADFERAEGRVLALPWLEGRVTTGADYLIESALPNLYFHLTTAYAILRHNGVDLGKRDYLGKVTSRNP
jgi:uncharacterized protein